MVCYGENVDHHISERVEKFDNDWDEAWRRLKRIADMTQDEFFAESDLEQKESEEEEDESEDEDHEGDEEDSGEDTEGVGYEDESEDEDHEGEDEEDQLN